MALVTHHYCCQLKPYYIGSVFGPIVENLYYQTKSASNCRSPGTHFQYKSFVIYWVRVLSVKFSLSLISPTFTVLWEGTFGPCQLATIDNSIRCNSLTALPYPLNSFACHIELIQWTWLGKQSSKPTVQRIVVVQDGTSGPVPNFANCVINELLIVRRYQLNLIHINFLNSQEKFCANSNR